MQLRMLCFVIRTGPMRLLTKRMLATLFFAASVLGSSPGASAQAKWVSLAPFPDPCPELIGSSANGKVYVFGGLLGNSVKGIVYEYDPAANKWTRTKKMPLPAHHGAAVGYKG